MNFRRDIPNPVFLPTPVKHPSLYLLVLVPPCTPPVADERRILILCFRLSILLSSLHSLPPFMFHLFTLLRFPPYHSPNTLEITKKDTLLSPNFSFFAPDPEPLLFYLLPACSCFFFSENMNIFYEISSSNEVIGQCHTISESDKISRKDGPIVMTVEKNLVSTILTSRVSIP